MTRQYLDLRNVQTGTGGRSAGGSVRGVKALGVKVTTPVNNVKLKNARNHTFTPKYAFTRTVLLLPLPLPAFKWKHLKETKCHFSGYSFYNRNLITSNEAVLRDCRSNISTPGTAYRPAATVISAGISDTGYKCCAVIYIWGHLMIQQSFEAMFLFRQIVSLLPYVSNLKAAKRKTVTTKIYQLSSF